MIQQQCSTGFETINRGYNQVFQSGKLSIGLTVPVESYPHSPIPSMADHVERIQQAERLGFAAVWLRDVPFNVPSFGDAGQIYDPFVYLGFIAGLTESIGIGVASIILPLRHPAHVAKAAASADALSNGRFLLGVASGDRPDEYPALDLPFETRGENFRDSFAYIRHMAETNPDFENSYGHLKSDIDMLPKPTSGRIPLLVTGHSRQTPEWIAKNSDGWILYPRNPSMQKAIVSDSKELVQSTGTRSLPIMQSLYLDLDEDPNTDPKGIHLGFRSGTAYLLKHLTALEDAGINHVALNLRFNRARIETTLERLADTVLPHFSAP
ncbi:MAG: LLM class oxidoreductase [Verrucomicrobiota bacterium]